jgi:beta-glucosidase
MSRIDDAVTRILRVKMRAGLFKPSAKPSKNPYAGKVSALQARDLARRAVRESLVLMKNNDAVLPLKPGKRVLVVGKNADNLVYQSGGWTITWQGDNTDNNDFPNADSVLSAIRQANTGGDVVYSINGEDVDVSSFDVVVAVVGETPYAEGKGDIKADMTLMHSQRFPEDLRVLQNVANKGVPVVTVLESGRPLYVPDLLNLSDSFVAAWLPGTEGKGISDVLFAKADGTPAYDFKGRSSFDWPAAACPDGRSSFARGYGLSYGQTSDIKDFRVITGVKACPF